MNFTNKLNQAITHNNSLLIVGLDPNPEMMALELKAVHFQLKFRLILMGAIFWEDQRYYQA